MTRPEAAGESEVRSVYFLNEILSPWILETEILVAQWHSEIIKQWLIRQGKVDAFFPTFP
jgi:hypothetical protein